MANSGTSLRFLTAMLATGQGTYRLDGTPRMRQRPVADLLAALNGLGADARSDLGTGCPPVTIQASGLDGGVRLRQGRRLQPVPQRAADGAALLARDVTTVEVQGVLVSQPYVAMTLAVMEAFGVTIDNRKFRRFDVRPAHYRGREYAIEPDASAASYFFALAAITGRDRHRRGPGRRRASRATWRSSTSWNTWAAPSPASPAGRPSPAGRSAPSTST